jgi:hypothetical protein
MHYDDRAMRARWTQTQRDGEAVIAYLTDQPDHEATHVMVSGGIDGDQPGVTRPGSVTTEHGFPQVQVTFDDRSTFGFHAARLAPYTPIRITDNGHVLCAVCHA